MRKPGKAAQKQALLVMVKTEVMGLKIKKEMVLEEKTTERTGLDCFRASQVVLVMKNPLDGQVRSQGREDPLEEEMATTPVLLPVEFPCTEEPAGLQSIGVLKESGSTEKKDCFKANGRPWSHSE